MKLDRTAWYIAKDRGVRRRPELVTDVRLFAPMATTAVAFADLELASELGIIQATAGERLGALFMRGGGGFARRAPPMWFSAGGLISSTMQRVRVRYFAGLRDPGGATGVTLRPVSRATIRAIQGVPSFDTDDELTTWLSTLGSP